MDEIKVLGDIDQVGRAVYMHHCPIWPRTWKPRYDDELLYNSQQLKLFAVQRGDVKQTILSELVVVVLDRAESWQCPRCQASLKFVGRILTTDRGPRAVLFGTLPRVAP